VGTPQPAQQQQQKSGFKLKLNNGARAGQGRVASRAGTESAAPSDDEEEDEE